MFDYDLTAGRPLTSPPRLRYRVGTPEVVAVRLRGELPAGIVSYKAAITLSLRACAPDILARTEDIDVDAGTDVITCRFLTDTNTWLAAVDGQQSGREAWFALRGFDAAGGELLYVPVQISVFPSADPPGLLPPPNTVPPQTIITLQGLTGAVKLLDADGNPLPTAGQAVIVPSGSGGTGDMRKAVYDTNNNGIVDRAETADAIGGKTAAEVAIAVDATANIPKPGIDGGFAPLSGGKIPVQYLDASASTHVVADIAARDALAPTKEGERAFVRDATGDPTVTEGAAEYIWDGAEWVKISEAESLDLILDWGNVQNKPATFPPSSHHHVAADITDLSITLSAYALKTEIPVNVSQLANDSEYITVAALSGYALKTEIPVKVSELTNDSGYITVAALSGYALKTEIPVNVSQLANDSEYITVAALSGYALKTEIPVNVSQLANDSGYITVAALSDYYTKTEVDTALEGKADLSVLESYTINGLRGTVKIYDADGNLIEVDEEENALHLPKISGPRGITIIADPVTDLPVIDPTWGYCRYLDSTYTRIAFVSRIRNLVRVRLEVVSANPALTGTVILVPVVNGIDQSPVTLNVGATPAEITFQLSFTSGTLVIKRTGGTLSDSGGMITAIVTVTVLEVQYA